MPHLALAHDLPPQVLAECLVPEALAFLGREVGPYVEVELRWREERHQNPTMRQPILAVSVPGLLRKDLKNFQ